MYHILEVREAPQSCALDCLLGFRALFDRDIGNTFIYELKSIQDATVQTFLTSDQPELAASQIFYLHNFS